MATTHDSTFGVAKQRLTSARQALLDAASLLDELGAHGAAKRYGEMARQIQVFPESPSHNDICGGCGSPADYERLRG